MPPARRALQEDSRPDEQPREKLKGASYGIGRGKRASNIANGTNLREIATSNSLAAATNGASLEQSQNGGSMINWNDAETDLLHRYRHAYHLHTPSAFSNPVAPIILSPRIGLGIGKYSPTMARAKSKRRIAKDQLALAVRKNFNALAVTEPDVIANLLYKVKHQGAGDAQLHFVERAGWDALTETTDKTFRMKFAPAKRKTADSGAGPVMADAPRSIPDRFDQLKGQQPR